MNLELKPGDIITDDKRQDYNYRLGTFKVTRVDGLKIYAIGISNNKYEDNREVFVSFAPQSETWSIVNKKKLLVRDLL